ncbi:MAG: arabinan endo-1,5-alpha-L-arabinosidase [Tepidisphaeraceae bacterium]
MPDRRQVLKLLGGAATLMATSPIEAADMPATTPATSPTTALSAETLPPAHDPVIAKENGVYHLFATHRLIQRWSSTDLVHWTKLPELLPEMPAWVTDVVPGCRGFWAPDISYHNDRWQVYYSASTFGSMQSAIGLATAPSLSPDAKWTDHGPIISTKKGSDWNAIDANFLFDEETKQPWLTLGSFWTGIKLFKLDRQTGLRDKSDETIHSIVRRPGDGAIEAPFLVKRHGWWYLLLSFDYCCRGADSTYNIRVVRSKSVTGPYVDKAGVEALQGGGSVLLRGYDYVRGPGHCAVLRDGDRDLLVHHFYDARKRGRPGLQVRPLTWDDDHWPVAGKPIE